MTLSFHTRRYITQAVRSALPRACAVDRQWIASIIDPNMGPTEEKRLYRLLYRTFGIRRNSRLDRQAIETLVAYALERMEEWQTRD